MAGPSFTLALSPIEDETKLVPNKRTRRPVRHSLAFAGRKRKFVLTNAF